MKRSIVFGVVTLCAFFILYLSDVSPGYNLVWIVFVAWALLVLIYILARIWIHQKYSGKKFDDLSGDNGSED